MVKSYEGDEPWMSIYENPKNKNFPQTVAKMKKFIFLHFLLVIDTKPMFLLVEAEADISKTSYIFRTQ